MALGAGLEAPVVSGQLRAARWIVIVQGSLLSAAVVTGAIVGRSTYVLNVLLVPVLPVVFGMLGSRWAERRWPLVRAGILRLCWRR